MRNALPAALVLLASAAAPAAAAGLCAATRVDAQAIGAYYRKIESVPDPSVRGLEGEAVLPEPRFDPERVYVATGPASGWESGPLDVPSVYMGLFSPKITIDVGLTWERIVDPDAGPAYTDFASDAATAPVSAEAGVVGSDRGQAGHRFFVSAGATGAVRLFDAAGISDATFQLSTGTTLDAALRARGLRPDFAFRPYWRTADSGGNVWGNPKLDDPIRFFPGEKILMRVRGTGPTSGEIFIESRSRPDASFRQTLTIADSMEDECVARKACSVKRVNSIDQFALEGDARRGEEGRPALPTRASAVDAAWTRTVLVDDRGRETPLDGTRCVEVRGADLAARYGSVFRVGGVNAAGGETLDILPSGAR